MKNILFAIAVLAFSGCSATAMKKPPQTQEEYCRQNPQAAVCEYSRRHRLTGSEARS